MGGLKGNRIRLALLALLLVGAALRLYDLNWDSGHHMHPDERWIVMVTSDLSWPKDLSEALNPRRSTFNPFYSVSEGKTRHFAYGHLPLYLLHLLAAALTKLAPLTAVFSPAASSELARSLDFGHLTLLGRGLSALFDTGTILLVYLLGKRLYERAVGLLAAVFLAFTVMHIQLAHFYAVDVVMAFFTVAAIYFDVRVAQKGRWRDSASAGICTGLAIASKFSAAPLLLPLAVAHFSASTRLSVLASWRPRLRLLLLSLLAAFLAYAVTSPFVLLDLRSFVESIGQESKMVRGVVDLPYTRQYRNTIPYLYQIEQQLRWGMGWPLGLAGFAGLAWAIVRLVHRHTSRGELVVLAWVVPYFLLTGSFMVKFMRYMVLVTPFLCIFGAALLLRLQRKLGILGHVLASLVIIGTILWAAAFMHIYAQPLTRVQASRWIYRHIPPGATITNEEWDDRLPFNLKVDGKLHTHGEYNIVRMALQEPDDERKPRHIAHALAQADYVIISSKRFYGWLPRLRDRFPITNRYYELLFAEKLGFELVEVFTNYPCLGPLIIVDDRADESFTVYDHPKVLIYRKVRQLSEEELHRLLSRGLEQERGENLLLDVPADELPVVDDFRWNGVANRHHLLGAAFWWLIVEVIGLGAWPLAFVLFRNLRDRGYILAKSFGLIIVAYLVWLPASLRLLRNTLPTYLLALFSLVLLSFYLLRKRHVEMATFWRERKPLIAFNEALFAFSFLIFVGIRFLNPDLWHPWNGGEKMMEFAFLNACLKSAHFPPYDPYFAGGYINYYYYGQFLISVLIKLTGIASSVAFNLAVPTLFALTVGNAFCVGYNLSRGAGKVAGLLAPLFVAVLGNLDGMVQMVGKLGEIGGSSFKSAIPGLEVLVRALPGLLRVLGGHTLPKFDYWGPTRVIPYTINEFPFFSFLFADLHPHTIGIPFTILVIALALNILLGEGRAVSGKWRVLSFQLLAISFCLGTLAVINTWDLPTYFILLAAAFLLGRWRRSKPLLATGLFAGAALVLGLALYWPFFAHYKALHVGIGLVKDRTQLENFLDIWGLFLFLALSFLIIELLRRRSKFGILRFLRLLLARWQVLPHLVELHKALVRRPKPRYLLGLCTLVAMVAIALGLALLKQWVLVILLPLLALAALPLWEAEPRERFILLLIAVGLSILLGCELIYLKDFLAGGNHYRMNTVFKFHIQAWVLLGLGTAAALPYIWACVDRWRSKWRWVWRGIFAFLILSSLVYPILGTPARVTDRFPGATPPLGTLDGMAYMRVGSYTWPEDNRIELKYDYQAIRWLLANVRGTPVIAEAAIGYYREGGLRVSSYTGLPTLLGMHQSEQRYPRQVGERDGKARELFNTSDLVRARQLIEELNISYIYIGQLERAVYEPTGLAKFKRMAEEGDLSLVYENERVRIYKVA